MTNRSRWWLLLLALPLGACTTNPVARLNADAGADMTIAPEESATLTATATGGVSPYTFHWSVTQQPEGAAVDLSGREVAKTLNTGVLAVAGAYQFRVRISDGNGESDASFVTVNVGGALAITATARDVLRAVGESTPLEVTFDASTTGLTAKSVEWRVVEGGASISDASSRTPNLTLNTEDSAKVRVTARATNADGEAQMGIAVVTVVGVRDATPQVVLENTGAVSGDMIIELFGDEAPNTVANFLRYVDSGYYDGLIWHRVDNGFVIQTGAYERVGGELVKRFSARPPIASEANNGRTNQRGAVGLALKGTDADSGDTQFYVDLADNFSLDTGTPAYTVFGRVVSGLEEVVDAIADVNVTTDGPGLTEVPVDDIVITRIYRIAQEIPTDSGSNGPLIEVDVTAEADDALRVVGESTQLRATVADPPEGLLYNWTVVSGAASFSNPASESTTVTINSADTVQLRVTVRGEGVKTTSADVYVVGVASATPRVIITNSGGVSGEIVLELLTEAAPKTVANFLRYVDDRFFDGVVWHRVDSGFVIQGGAFERTAEGLVAREGVRDPVESEANNGESNVRGTVAMALRGTNANSGTNQFFVNLGDNSSLDNGNPPFTVFARVVEGLDVVDDISTVAVGTDALSGLSDVPVDDIVMTSVRRESNSAGGALATFASAATLDTTARAFAAANLMLDLRNAVVDFDEPFALIAGGLHAPTNGDLQSLSTVSFFNPRTRAFASAYTAPNATASNTFTLATPRSHHLQITTRRGEVLIIGGETGASGDSFGAPTATVEMFDPSAGELTQLASMHVARGNGQTATRMPVTRTVVAGGDSWEVYSPNDDAWEGPYDLLHTRLFHSSVLLRDINNASNDPFVNPDHRALLIGGEGDGSMTFEMLQPDDGSSDALNSVLPRGLKRAAAVNIDEDDNNDVLIAGGIDIATGDTVADAYLLRPEDDVLDSVDPLPDLPNGAAGQQVVFLGNRYAVFLGGEQVINGTATALDYYAIFDRDTETWVEHGAMLTARTNFAVTVLDDRTALIVGGSDAADPPTEFRNDAEILTLNIDTNGS
ncbi:MAG TPA: peptidylprolyl isomerase [Phycisphaerae bacterium]|nr:peptidylprolyl isomerase [Phycisphaerae bacterium]